MHPSTCFFKYGTHESLSDLSCVITLISFVSWARRKLLIEPRHPLKITFASQIQLPELFRLRAREVVIMMHGTWHVFMTPSLQSDPRMNNNLDDAAHNEDLRGSHEYIQKQVWGERILTWQSIKGFGFELVERSFLQCILLFCSPPNHIFRNHLCTLGCRSILRCVLCTWDAPLLLPDCSPITPSRPWRICSSEKFLSFLVAILGPRVGPVYSSCFWVARPTNINIQSLHQSSWWSCHRERRCRATPGAGSEPQTSQGSGKLPRQALRTFWPRSERSWHSPSAKRRDPENQNPVSLFDDLSHSQCCQE